MANFYMKDIESWRDATLMLTLEQKGFFNELLDLIYLYDGCLKDDNDLICRAMPINKKIMLRIKAILLKQGLIELRNGFIFNSRCTQELLKINSKSTQNKVKADKRWAKVLKLKQLDDANAYANAMPIVKDESKEKEDIRISSKKVSAQNVVKLWNKKMGENIKKISKHRHKLIEQITDSYFHELKDWEEYFQIYSDSDFLSGKKTAFKARFTWSLNPANIDKVLDGDFSNELFKNNNFDIKEFMKNERKKDNGDK